MRVLTEDDYSNLLRFRTALRRFDAWSHDQAQEVGLTHAQHQLLPAIKDHPDPRGPTIGEAAEYLNTRHHSVVGLVDRSERLGVLRRLRDTSDARVVRLGLTEHGARCLARLTDVHLKELARLAPVLQHLLEHAPDLQARPEAPSRRGRSAVRRVGSGRGSNRARTCF